jgi:hypothetical protein
MDMTYPIKKYWKPEEGLGVLLSDTDSTTLLLILGYAIFVPAIIKVIKIRRSNLQKMIEKSNEGLRSLSEDIRHLRSEGLLGQGVDENFVNTIINSNSLENNNQVIS